jgi:hypothetical protein
MGAPSLDVDLGTLPERLRGVSWSERLLLTDLIERQNGRMTARQRGRIRRVAIARHVVLGKVFGAKVERNRFREEALASKGGPVDLCLPAWRGRTTELVEETMCRFRVAETSSIHRIVREHQQEAAASLFVAVDQLAPGDLCYGAGERSDPPSK